jgi:glycosyltransferase involved in cell wall biosynthesis
MVKISVVITTRNRSALVLRSIDSVLCQDYDNFDIHIVDDASDDDTWERLRRVKKFNKNVYCWRHEVKRGLSATRNTGIIHSEGEYITFLDDDDIYKSDCISKRVDLINNLSNEQLIKLGVVYCGNEIHIIHEKRIVPNLPKIQGSIKEFLIKHKSVFPAPSSTLMFPKNVLKKIGCFDENLISSVDHDIWTNLASNDYFAFGVEDTPVIIYQAKRKQSMVSNTKPRIIGVEQYLVKWKSTFQDWYGIHNANRFIKRYRTDVLGKLAAQKFADGNFVDAFHLTKHVINKNGLLSLEVFRLFGHYMRFLIRICIPKRLITMIRGS